MLDLHKLNWNKHVNWNDMEEHNQFQLRTVLDYDN